MKWSFTLIMHEKARVSLKCPKLHKCYYLHLILDVMDSFCTTAIYFTFHTKVTGHSKPECGECSCTQILLCLTLLQCARDLAHVPKVRVSMRSPKAILLWDEVKSYFANCLILQSQLSYLFLLVLQVLLCSMCVLGKRAFLTHTCR